jgi:hypothetical protein
MAWHTLQGKKAINMLPKDHWYGISRGDVLVEHCGIA